MKIKKGEKCKKQTNKKGEKKSKTNDNLKTNVNPKPVTLKCVKVAGI